MGRDIVSRGRDPYETEHHFLRDDLGPPHEHELWRCECGAWWYWGGCTWCGPNPTYARGDYHCRVWCLELVGGGCIADLPVPKGERPWSRDF